MKRRSFHPWLASCWWAAMVFFYLPLIIVVIFSFNSINSATHFAGFSLRWYQQLLGNEQIITALRNSMVLAVGSSCLALVLGTLLGYGLYRHRGKRVGWLIALIYLPIVMPDVVFGIADMSFFVRLNSWTGLFAPGLTTMLLAHVTFQIPFVALLIYSRFVGLDPTLFDAAKDLYANPWKRMQLFILPSLKPSLVAGFFLAFTLSFDDFVISFFTSGPESVTLPIYIWGAIRRGVSPEINAIGALMIGGGLLAALGSMVVTLRVQRRQAERPLVKATP
ncbi:ABC transporter permease [Zymobacter palmae]|uniref:ABC-type spermidine/putrescine transport system n=1 Tax=Zymobacter palmae TaxID=33074 RepID=A0A348HC46_9GAMM|nr:ABC transporter permease [Zymobacter palmae]BBG29198.1 ABC-type spermidine/putrescine transport system [Zymobacter palmae]